VAAAISKLSCESCESWPLLVALVGIPGSGKSTSADIIANLVGRSNCMVMPMDGYHYCLADLKAMPQPEDKVYRRGAPDTFDAVALQRDLRSIRDGDDRISLPGFDHAAGDPDPGQHTFVRAQHKVVIVEGLYLLHEGGAWVGTSALFDLRVFIRSDVDTCVARLKIRNKCIPGYTAEEIDIRCDVVDRANAELVALDVQRADITFQSCT